MREGKKEEEIDGVRRERESKREKKRDRETHTQRNRECNKQLRSDEFQPTLSFSNNSGSRTLYPCLKSHFDDITG